MTGSEDPEYADIDGQASSVQVLAYAMQMADIKTKKPGDDIVTTLVQGRHRRREAVGRGIRFLRPHAGRGRKRDNAPLHYPGHDGVHRLPRPVGAVQADRPETAADEIVRWATPITAFQRTALEDTELSGVQIRRASGWCCSTGRPILTTRCSTTPTSFDILRNPNPHVGFGGTGAHYCIGANLARMTINLIFNAIADHMPDLRAACRRRSGCARAGSTASSTGRSTTPAPRRSHTPASDGHAAMPHRRTTRLPCRSLSASEETWALYQVGRAGALRPMPLRRLSG